MRDHAGDNNILWAEVGEKLDLSIDMMKKIRAEYGQILGLTGSRRVARDLLPVIRDIAGFIKDGMSREEIESKFRGSSGPEPYLQSPEQVAVTVQEQLVSKSSHEDFQEQIEDSDLHTKECQTGTAKVVGEVSAVLELVGGNMFSSEEQIHELKNQINYNGACQRESIAKLTLAVQRLTQEVKDLRYCMVLAATRRDRKRGYSGLSRLLSGKP